MRKIIFTMSMLIILVSCLAGTAAASTISFDPAAIAVSPGSTTQVKVVLSDAPQGLAGYKLTVKYPSSIATVSSVSFPSWGSSLNMKTPVTGGYLVSAVDLNKQVQSGSNNIELGTITVKGVSAGSATFTIADIQMNDDDDAVITPTTDSLDVTVEGSAASTTATTTTTTSATATTAASTTTTATTTATTTTVTTGPTAATTTAAVTSTTIVPAATVTVPPPVMVTPAIAGYPTSGFTVSTTAGYAPLEVQFHDLSKGESLTGWEWSFGDGGTSMAQNPGYTYSTPGTYTVTLTATNVLGSTTSTRTGLIRVLGPGEPMPTVAHEAIPVTAETTQPVHTIPAWTPPSTTPTPQAASGIITVIAAAGLALAGYAILRKKQDR
jgi:PKD repeat protein